jgi:hypothetical protein
MAGEPIARASFNAKRSCHRGSRGGRLLGKVTCGTTVGAAGGLRIDLYAKPPFAGPEAVLAYLSRYTHRVAISNSRLLRFNEADVTFRYKDYRRDSADRQQVMTLPPPPDADPPEEPIDVHTVCPCCGGHMIIIETFARWGQPRAPPYPTRSTGRTAS